MSKIENKTKKDRLQHKVYRQKLNINVTSNDIKNGKVGERYMYRIPEKRQNREEVKREDRNNLELWPRGQGKDKS